MARTETTEDVLGQTVSFDAVEPRAPAMAAAATRPRYTVVGEVARGGLGRVLAARDERLDRQVAVKELLPSAATATNLKRFQREAALTARLQHPSIVPIYDSGVDGAGQPFYVMKLLSTGRTLRQAVADAAGLDERLALLPHVVAVADAIAYAHSLGVIHRDIKPSNVILGPFGETVVIDWGLAKALGEHDTPSGSEPYRAQHGDATSVGSIVGTPHYMAPEQARGEAVDKRADVYALGALLHHVLTGRPPFGDLPTPEVLRRAAAGDVAPVVADKRVPPDLAAIVRKATRSDAAQRYASAEDLADDLKRFSTGQLVGAHQYSLGTLVWRRLQRHKLLAAAASVFIVVLAATIAVSVERIGRERTAAVAERNRLILAQAKSSLTSDPTAALAWLKRYPRDGADWDVAQTIAADADARGVARHLLPTMSQSLALLPDGKRAVTGGPDRTATVWDLASGQPRASARFDSDVTRVATDGETIAVADRGGEVFLWRDGERRLVRRFIGGAFHVSFAAGRLAAASLDTIALVDVASGHERAALHVDDVITIVRATAGGAIFGTTHGKLVEWTAATGARRAFAGHVGAVNWIALSPDGASLVSGGNDGTVRLWDRARSTGRVLGTHDGLVRVATFAPDGKSIVSGGLDGKVRLWPLDGGAARLLDGHADLVNDVAFSPDGATLASCGPDRQVHLTDIASGETRVLFGHAGDLGDCPFASDGTTLVSTGYDQQTRVWSFVQPPGRVIGRHRMEALQALFSPDGASVVSVGTEKVARLWDPARASERPLTGNDFSGMALPTLAAFSADGTLLAAAGDNVVRAWELPGARLHTLTLERVQPLRLVVDGAHVYIACSDGTIRAWQPRTGAHEVWRGHDGPIGIARLDGSVVSVGEDRTLRLWHDGTSEIVARLPERPSRLVADGRTAAIGDESGAIHLWTRERGLRTLAGHPDAVRVLAFSPDGKLLASASEDSIVRLWRVDDGALVRTLRTHDEAVRALAFSPDGALLATAGNDRAIQVHDLRDGSLMMLRGHVAAVRSLDFSPDGARLVSASEDGTVRLWHVDRARLVPAAPPALAQWLERQTSATVPYATQRRAR